MLKIAAHIPNPHDATAHYRATGPFSHLRKRLIGDLQFDLIQEWSAPRIHHYDLAFFQRPSTPSELEAIRICNRLGVPVIVDYDDLLFDIPVDNPSYQAYMNKATQETLIQIIGSATCVWVSTKELKRCLQLPKKSLNEKVYVIPNALDDLHLATGKRGLPPPPERRQPAVLWRGSETHQQDVMEYTPEIGEAAKRFKKHSFVFVGWNPWFLTRVLGSQAVCSGRMPVGEFMDFLYATGAQIGIIPLHDSRFNRCKSNIAWLEMSWSGSVCLAPDWEEWRQPGVVTYRNPDDFKAGLMALLSMEPKQLSELHRMSWNHIVKHFTLSSVNQLRADTIIACLDGAKWPDGWQRIPDPDEEAMELA